MDTHTCTQQSIFMISNDFAITASREAVRLTATEEPSGSERETKNDFRIDGVDDAFPPAVQEKSKKRFYEAMLAVQYLVLVCDIFLFQKQNFENFFRL